MKTIFISNFCLMAVLFFVFSCGGSESSPSPTPSPADCSKKPSVSVSAIVASACGQTGGSFEVTASGGVGKLTYSINGTNFQDANSFKNLAAGKYTVTVKDANGCSNTAQASIESGTSYQTSIKSIIEANCATSGCHSGAQSPNFTSFANIQANAEKIKARTVAKTMPPSGGLTDQQINLIKCWVDDGAKNN